MKNDGGFYYICALFDKRWGGLLQSVGCGNPFFLVTLFVR